MPISDYEITLVSAAKGGNLQCFEELFNLYYQKVFALARMTVKNSADAEDILQQTFINAWRNLSKLDDPAAFNTWIQKITLNLCYSHLRRKDIAILIDAENEDAGFIAGDTELLLPEVYAERDDLRQRLGRIIDSLSEVQKQTVLLFYFDELKVDEIAEVMACSPGTVKTRLFLARKAIRAEIEEQERRSGQKFYGIAGIPLLGLSEILAGQAEAAGLPAGTAGSILGKISASIAGDAVSAAQGTAAAGGASSIAPLEVAAGTAAKAGMPLAAKIVAGIVAAGLLGGGIWFAVQNPGGSTPYVSEAPSTAASETADDPYYTSLSDEQKLLLSELEAALLASDYETAHVIQHSAEFHALCDAIPDWGGFWYYPDGETSVLVYRGGQEDAAAYEMSVYAGKDGVGQYRLGKYGGDSFLDYILHETAYSGGRANGPFTSYFFHYTEDGKVEFYTFDGTLTDGKADGPVQVRREGEDYGFSKPESHSWWPDWPER